MSNSKMCYVPWSHLQIDPDGSARPCCIMQPTSDSTLGNIHNSSIDELWNAERLKQLRVNLLSGKGDDLCKICANYDDAGLSSFRQGYINYTVPRLTNVQKAIEETDETGFCPSTNLEYWDFRFSNMCNFKCRTCGPSYSHSWYKDAEKLNWPLPENKRPITWLSKVEDRVDTLVPHVKNVKEIYFAGGEPLIMEEHIRTLDLLLEQGRTDLKLRYNTNLSTLSYKGRDILNDYWLKFDNVVIAGSLDAIGDRAEYIRSGTKWNVVDLNIRRLVEANKNHRRRFTMLFNVTISTLNVFYLDELLKYMIDIGAIENLSSYESRPSPFLFNLVFYPDYYCIKNLPDSAKQEARERLQRFDNEIQQKYGITYSFFTDLYPILDQPSDPETFEKFRFMTAELDNIRGESIESTLPELWKHYK